MRKILIATSNPGKFEEIRTELADAHFQFVNLHDVKLDHIKLDEPYETTWENALHKAQFFAKKSKLITVAEDTGLYVQALGGAPGVHTKRTGETSKERVEWIMKQMKDVPLAKRGAYFLTHCAIVDPQGGVFSVFEGRIDGRIAQKLHGQARPGMEHDILFYYPQQKKYFSQMSALDKNLISHRGQAIIKLKVFLQRQYGFKEIMVPLALVVQGRKLLLTLRRDSRPQFNNKWEFPGGGVDVGESVEECVIRETKEETGLRIKIIDRLPHIISPRTPEKQGFYKVYLVGFVAQTLSGTFRTADNESAGHGWYTLAQALRLKLLPLNKEFILKHKTLLKKYID